MNHQEAIAEAKETLWHVEKSNDGTFLVCRGESCLSIMYASFADAADEAANRNIMGSYGVKPDTLVMLLDAAAAFSRVKERAQRMAQKYREHPAFQPDNTAEDIFGKLTRIIETEKLS